MKVVEGEIKEDQKNPDLYVVQAQLHILFGQVTRAISTALKVAAAVVFLLAQSGLQRCLQFTATGSGSL